jgi:hypothetical protein
MPALAIPQRRLRLTLFIFSIFFTLPFDAVGAAELIQVTTTGGWDPAVSQDGLWVAHRRSPGGMVKVHADGTGSEILSSSYPLDLDWRRPGDLIIASRDGALYTVDATNGDSAYVRAGSLEDLAWSPLGNEIASYGNWIVDYPSGALSLIPCSDPDGTECAGEDPTWSPDAQWIAFEDGLEILKVRRSGGLAEVVVAGLGDVTGPRWSPDGRWIAFTRVERTQSGDSFTNIWVADARGTAYGLVQVTSGSYRDGNADWAPDSKTIFFDSDRSGQDQDQIWKVAFDAPSAVIRSTISAIKSRYR